MEPTYYVAYCSNDTTIIIGLDLLFIYYYGYVQLTAERFRLTKLYIDAAIYKVHIDAKIYIIQKVRMIKTFTRVIAKKIVPIDSGIFRKNINFQKIVAPYP